MNQWLEEHRALVLASVGLLIAAGAAALLIRWRRPPPIVIQLPPPTETAAPTGMPGPIRVYVSGAVSRADVYELAPDTIVRDALAAAGGPAADADLDRINLANPLRDGDQVHVPRIGEAPTPVPEAEGGAEQPTLTGPLNINTATQEELELLPGIGPVIAQRIVEHRDTYGPFPAIEAIQNVPGIGPAKFAAIKDWITVE